MIAINNPGDVDHFADQGVSYLMIQGFSLSLRVPLTAPHHKISRVRSGCSWDDRDGGDVDHDGGNVDHDGGNVDGNRWILDNDKKLTQIQQFCEQRWEPHREQWGRLQPDVEDSKDMIFKWL